MSFAVFERRHLIVPVCLPGPDFQNIGSVPPNVKRIALACYRFTNMLASVTFCTHVLTPNEASNIVFVNMAIGRGFLLDYADTTLIHATVKCRSTPLTSRRHTDRFAGSLAHSGRTRLRRANGGTDIFVF